MASGKGPLQKNLTRQKWHLKDGVEVHIIYNFYRLYMSKIQHNIENFASYRKIR